MGNITTSIVGPSLSYSLE